MRLCGSSKIAPSSDTPVTHLGVQNFSKTSHLCKCHNGRTITGFRLVVTSEICLCLYVRVLNLSWAQKNFPSADDCENSLLMSHTRTVKVKHPGNKKQNMFFKDAFYRMYSAVAKRCCLCNLTANNTRPAQSIVSYLWHWTGKNANTLPNSYTYKVQHKTITLFNFLFSVL